MSPKGLNWCGEGDLFSRSALKTSKLYKPRTTQNTQSATNTRLSHTASHTAQNAGCNRLAAASPHDAAITHHGTQAVASEVAR